MSVPSCTHKTCPSCECRMPVAQFRLLSRGKKKPPEKRTSSSYEPYCIECANKRSRERNAKSRRANPKQYAETFRAWALQKKYGMTKEQYAVMLAEQNGCCKICRRHHSETKRGLVVDHDHETGKIRGLLCDGCNRGVGMLQDKPELLRRAADYLDAAKVPVRSVA